MNPLRNERGMALVIVLAMLAMISLIGIAAVRNSSTEMDISEALIHRTKSFYTAEAGLELAVATMRANPDMVNKDSLLSIINVDSVLGDGSFQVQMANTYPIRTVSSFGHDIQGEAGVAVDVYHRRTPINAWNNAIADSYLFQKAFFPVPEKEGIISYLSLQSHIETFAQQP